MSDSARPPLDRTHVHNLILLYMAVAYGADHDFGDAEAHAIERLLTAWLPGTSKRELEGLVQAAFEVSLRGEALSVDGLALGLRSVLPLEFRDRVLADMSRVARADGEASTAEVAVIQRVRQIWAG